MALVRLKAPYGSVSGKIGTGPDASVVYEVDGRSILRNNAISRDPQTLRQRLQRAGVEQVSKVYRTLSVQESDSWRTYIQNLHALQCPGIKTPKRGYDAFRQINIHRFAAGEEMTRFAPLPEVYSAAIATPVVTLADEKELRVRFDHPFAEGTVRWRVHVTPPLDFAGQFAKRDAYRSPMAEQGAGYYVGKGFLENLVVRTDWKYQMGKTLGVKVMVLSADFVPGGESVYRRLEVN